MTPRTTQVLRVVMLVVIATVALANAIGWVDPDLWIPFVCIIAVMGVGTRGGVLDSLAFVLVEAAVVLILGVATFSGSRDFVWAASVAVSVLAVGKIGLLEMQRSERRAPGSRVAARPVGRSERSPVEHNVGGERLAALVPDGARDDAPAQPLGTVPASDVEHASGRAAGIASPDDADPERPAPRRRRERDDQTPVQSSR